MNEGTSCVSELTTKVPVMNAVRVSAAASKDVRTWLLAVATVLVCGIVLRTQASEVSLGYLC